MLCSGNPKSPQPASFQVRLAAQARVGHVVGGFAIDVAEILVGLARRDGTRAQIARRAVDARRVDLGGNVPPS